MKRGACPSAICGPENSLCAPYIQFWCCGKRTATRRPTFDAACSDPCDYRSFASNITVINFPEGRFP